MIISPSILNADNLNLGINIQQAKEAGIERFHIDIMDGHFVPNLSFGPQLVLDFKKKFPTEKAEIHLMSNNLKILLPEFVKAGADIIEFHYEATDKSDIGMWLDYLRNHRIKTGIVINPETPVSVLEKYIPNIDQVLIMSVHPGFGGQKFISNSLDKIEKVKDMIKSMNASVSIEIDGGVNDTNIKSCKQAGTDIAVVGSYIFKDSDPQKNIVRLNSIIN